MRKLLIAALVLVPALVGAQTHPRAIWKGSILTRLEAKRSGGDTSWVGLKANCDTFVVTTAGQPDSLPPVYAPREPRTATPPGYIWADYQGFGYYYTTFNLITCYYTMLGTDPTLANKYKAQLVKIAQKAAAPMAVLTPATPPTGWNVGGIGLTSRVVHYVDNTGGSNQARVYIVNHGLANGATVTLSGVLGCTTANITGKVAETSANQFDLVEADGVTPVVCNAAGTNYNQNLASDASYPMRTYGVLLPLIYDNFSADLSAGDKTNLYETCNRFFDEFRYISPGYYRNTQNNYHAGYFNGVGLTGILTRGAGENPRGEELYSYWRNTLFELQDKVFFNRWLGNNGGFPEAIRYQALSMNSIAWTLLAQWDANGEDLFTGFPWIQDLMKYWIHNTMPPRNYLSYRGFIPSPNDGTGTNPNPWADLSSTLWIVHHIADLKSDSFRPKFHKWIVDLMTQNVPQGSNNVNRVLFYDGSLSQTDWTTETPSSAEQSNPAGGYGRVLMRSDWTTGAVFADLMVSPHLSTMGNGKERRDKGSIYVQRGDVHLLISSTAEATRANNVTAYNAAHDSTGNTEDDYYGIYWNITSGGSRAAYQAFAGAPVTNQFSSPGYRDSYPSVVVTSNPARIDRYIDATSYVYSRGVSLGQMYAQQCNPSCAYRQEWEREMIYLRPKLFVVYDRTRKMLASQSQRLSWLTGKTATTTAYGSMYRTEVADGAIYKGMLTHMLPALAVPVVTDFGSRHIQFRIETSPAVEAEYVNWMTTIDAADAQANVADVALFSTRSNIDVGRLGTDIVVGFSNQQWSATPVLTFPKTYTMSGMGSTVTHYLCGLAVSTTYKRTVSGNDVTIATSGGGIDTATDNAGCMTFQSGAVTNPDVVISTTALPDALRGVAYNQTIAVTGGDGGPYTCSLSSGSLPTGLTLNANCTITGTPTIALQNPSFAVIASDGTDDSDPKTLSILVASNPVNITTLSVGNGVDDQPYSATICAEGGITSYVYTHTAGTLPTGVTLTSGSPCATLGGTTTTAGEFTFTITVEDQLGQTDPQVYTMQVIPSPLIELSVSVQYGSNAALVTFGVPGLPPGTACQVSILESGVPIKTNEETLRFARQRSSFQGLQPSTNYGATASCPGASSPQIVPFTTLPFTAATKIVRFGPFSPVTFFPTAAKVTLSVSGQAAQTVACTTTCVFDLTLAPDIYTWSYIYKTAADVVLATSNSREYIVP